MKARLVGLMVGAGLVLAAGDGIAVVPLPGGTPVPGSAVRDSSGEIVGAVVGFDNRRPNILLRNGTETALLFVEEDFTFSAPVSVYYGADDCAGSPVAIESFTKFGAKGFMEWQGRVYSVGNGNTLVRNTNTTSQSITVESRFISVNSPGSQCLDVSGSEPDLFPAEVVDDLDNLFVPPFTLE